MLIKWFVVLMISLSVPSVLANSLAKMIESNLPFVVSATPGVFDRFQFDATDRNLAGHTLCVVGSDKLSIYWLENRKEVLLKYRVVCYLANVSTLAEIDAVRRAAHPVPVVLTSAEELVSIFNIKRYPAIIHSNWVFQ